VEGFKKANHLLKGPLKKNFKKPLTANGRPVCLSPRLAGGWETFQTSQQPQFPDKVFQSFVKQ
jgi:hypothetical protein